MIDVYYFKIYINCIYIQGFDDVYICTYLSTESGRAVCAGSQGHMCRVICCWPLSGDISSGPVGRRLIWTKHREVALIGHLALLQIRPLALPRNRPLALPWSWHLALGRSWHPALPRSWHLSLTRQVQREPVVLCLTIRATWSGSIPGERIVRHISPMATDPIKTFLCPVSSHMTRSSDPKLRKH